MKKRNELIIGVIAGIVIGSFISQNNKSEKKKEKKIISNYMFLDFLKKKENVKEKQEADEYFVQEVQVMKEIPEEMEKPTVTKSELEQEVIKKESIDS